MEYRHGAAAERWGMQLGLDGIEVLVKEINDTTSAYGQTE